MKSYFAVVAIVKNGDKILILKKSSDDWNYPNHWSFCSGFVKEYESGEDNILREIKEETGLKGKIVKTGTVFEKKDTKKKKIWIVKPYICAANSRKVKLCHENSEFKWIYAKDINKYKCVPGIRQDLSNLGLIKQKNE
jgi:ADP-ribose pyrophosphatase YjhB (NUDIX family)